MDINDVQMMYVINKLICNIVLQTVEKKCKKTMDY